MSRSLSYTIPKTILGKNCTGKKEKETSATISWVYCYYFDKRSWCDVRYEITFIVMYRKNSRPYQKKCFQHTIWQFYRALICSRLLVFSEISRRLENDGNIRMLYSKRGNWEKNKNAAEHSNCIVAKHRTKKDLFLVMVYAEFFENACLAEVEG